jgi:hypothetical protein
MSFYHEQSYLLDPFLDQLINPLMESLRTFLTSPNARAETPVLERANRVAELLYSYMNCRGYKAIRSSASLQSFRVAALRR